MILFVMFCNWYVAAQLSFSVTFSTGPKQSLGSLDVRVQTVDL